MRRCENVRRNNLFQQARKLLISEIDAIELLKLCAKVGFERSAVANVGAIAVLEVVELGEQALLDLVFGHSHESVLPS
ncbi:hypothetical protein D3C81_2052900 [compost metagenome]